MPRYYFDIDDGNEIRDVVGRAMEGGDILREEALNVVADLMKIEAKDTKEAAIHLKIRDEDGNQCLVIRLICQVE